jgi:predicted Rossmann fold nucleotide-binding protein DprA/Smf involved in DNA uptake
MTQVDRGVLAWNALRLTPGLGPKRLASIALVLARQQRGASDLLGRTADEIRALGLSGSLAEQAAKTLERPPAPSPVPKGARLVTPDDEEYPLDRLSPHLPLPAILYCWGNVALLSSGGLAVSGSRRPDPMAINYALEVSRLAAEAGINVISGHAAGVDEAGHTGSLGAGGTTTVVLAEGLRDFKPRSALRGADPEHILIVSEFEPSERWTSYRAMQRNTTIAALADAVLVVAANEAGGAWAQGELCLQASKSLLVPSFPSDVAPGNAKLIEMGGTPVDPTNPASVLVFIDEQPRGVATQLPFFS